MPHPSDIKVRFRVLRSKNAGPFIITLDVISQSEADFHQIKASLTKTAVAQAYRIDDADVLSIEFAEQLRAIKININRRFPSGHPGDSDCYGMNQEEPLAELLCRIVGI